MVGSREKQKGAHGTGRAAWGRRVLMASQAQGCAPPPPVLRILRYDFGYLLSVTDEDSPDGGFYAQIRIGNGPFIRLQKQTHFHTAIQPDTWHYVTGIFSSARSAGQAWRSGRRWPMSCVLPVAHVFCFHGG